MIYTNSYVLEVRVFRMGVLGNVLVRVRDNFIKYVVLNILGDGMRLVGYVRVSEESENPENQKYAIFEWCSKKGYQLIDVFVDVGISGALPPKDRPGFKKVLEVLPGVDGVVVYALDRIARSLEELYTTIKEIEGMGKVVISVREEWLEAIDPRVRGLILAILGWAAEIEREFIRERTKLALQRLKAKGKRLGRPKKVNDTICLEAIKYVDRGYTLKDAAKLLNVGYSTLARYILSNPSLRKQYYEARARSKSRRK
jgi:DNA invertase Pin-like site-specific DNA recombinase